MYLTVCTMQRSEAVLWSSRALLDLPLGGRAHDHQSNPK